MAAQRVIAFKLTADAGQSVEETEKLEASLKDVNKEVDKLNQQPVTLDKKLEDLNKKVKSGELDMRGLSKAVKEYQSIALQAGRTSVVGKEALKQAGNLQDKISDLRGEVKNLGHDGANMQAAMQLGSTVVAGYTAFKGITAALGMENEDLQKTFVQLQGAQSALMAIEQIRANFEKESFLMIKGKIVATKLLSAVTAVYTAVQKGLNLAFKSFPLILIIAGIATLIGYFADLGSAAKQVWEWIVGFTKDILSFFGLYDEAAAASAEQARQQREEITKAHQERLKQLKEQRDEERQQFTARQTQYDLEIERMEAVGKSSLALRLQKAQDLKAEIESQLQFIKDSSASWQLYYENLMAQRGMSREDFIKQLKGQGIDIENLQKQQQELLTNLENQVFSSQSQILKIERDINKERLSAAKEQWDKRENIERMGAHTTMKAAQEELLKLSDTRNKIQEEELANKKTFWDAYAKMSADAYAAEMEARQKELEKRKEDINTVMAVLGSAMELANEINALLNQLGEQRQEKIQEDADARLAILGEEKRKELSDQSLTNDSRARLEYQFALQEYKIKVEAQKKQDEIAKKAFNRMKALKLVEIAINTSASVMQALGGFPPPASFIFAGINATMGAVQMAAVAAQKFKSDGGSISPPTFTAPTSTGDISSGGGSDSGGGSGGGGGGQNDIITDTDNLLNKPHKVYVSQVEINENASQMSKVEQVATI